MGRLTNKVSVKGVHAFLETAFHAIGTAFVGLQEMTTDDGQADPTPIISMRVNIRKAYADADDCMVRAPEVAPSPLYGYSWNRARLPQQRSGLGESSLVFRLPIMAGRKDLRRRLPTPVASKILFGRSDPIRIIWLRRGLRRGTRIARVNVKHLAFGSQSQQVSIATFMSEQSLKWNYATSSQAFEANRPLQITTMPRKATQGALNDLLQPHRVRSPPA